jgi:hypothetical protein
MNNEPITGEQLEALRLLITEDTDSSNRDAKIVITRLIDDIYRLRVKAANLEELILEYD